MPQPGRRRFEVRVDLAFQAAHNLRQYRGLTEPLHGHSWKVEVFISGLPDHEGLVIDFVEVQSALRRIVEPLDYHYINDVVPFDQINPTAENIAAWIFNQLDPLVSTESRRLEKVTVWEGKRAAASCLR
ncbi:MAG: 6-pyruvoyl trahydropterin synthase family protein [Acidobacteriota bacterium]